MYCLLKDFIEVKRITIFGDRNDFSYLINVNCFSDDAV